MAKNANTTMDAKKVMALEALAESSTLTEAAQKAGVSRRSLYSWCRNDVQFAVALKSQQEQLLMAAMERASAQRAHAEEVLASMLDDEEQPGAVRVKAALSIIDRADKLSSEALSIADSHVKANTTVDFENMFAKEPH